MYFVTMVYFQIFMLIQLSVVMIDAANNFAWLMIKLVVYPWLLHHVVSLNCVQCLNIEEYTIWVLVSISVLRRLLLKLSIDLYNLFYTLPRLNHKNNYINPEDKNCLIPKTVCSRWSLHIPRCFLWACT